jgi:hypothetical protein
MENLQKDDTFKFFVAIGIIFGAVSGYVNLIEFLEKKEIHRKQLAKSKTSITE